MSFYNFKKIQVVPPSNDFIDIILSKTQRKTPTVVHKHYKISRIRGFYMRKVKFTQENFTEKLAQILSDFPKLEDIHPFYADLINVLYDRDHYKLALGQLNTARHLIDNVGKDYVRLLKYGDSLYRCKQLKIAALGRMATIMKKQKDTLGYLEQVRQHLSRLPSIDPNTRTLLVCGYPNVGKSSFMNKVTRADVQVEPYAFTTKSLFVGHLDYKYLRWQVIDTPGILDHPLEDRNTIEMQSITAMAHLRACILFFIDLTEQCGYSIQEQVKLFHSIRPLFANKPTVLVVNKIDKMKPEDLDPERKVLIDDIVKSGVDMACMSCFMDEGVMEVRNKACEKLLAARIGTKMNSQKINGVLNKLHLAVPKPRDDAIRAPFIPESCKHKVRYDANDPSRPKLEKDIEIENGGAGVYSVDLRKKYLLENPEWKYDCIPEIMDGKNIADFIDPEIEAKLNALEREEERLVEEGFYKSDDEMVDSEEEEIREAAENIRNKKQLLKIKRQIHRGPSNRPIMPKFVVAKTKSIQDMSSQFESLGVDTNKLVRARSQNRKRTRSQFRESETAAKGGEVNERTGSVLRNRSESCFRNVKQKVDAEKIRKITNRGYLFTGQRGEADREILNTRPKHLLSGKRGIGSTSRR